MSRIPELLVSFSGEKIDSVSKWESFRREEIINAFEMNMYGVRDIERPENLTFKNKGESIFSRMRVKDIQASFDSFNMNFKLYLPEKSEKPLPTIVFIMHEAMYNNLCFDDFRIYIRKILI